MPVTAYTMPTAIAARPWPVLANTRRSQNDRFAVTFTRRHRHIAAGQYQPEVV